MSIDNKKISLYIFFFIIFLDYKMKWIDCSKSYEQGVIIYTIAFESVINQNILFFEFPITIIQFPLKFLKDSYFFNFWRHLYFLSLLLSAYILCYMLNWKLVQFMNFVNLLQCIFIIYGCIFMKQTSYLINEGNW